MTRERRMWRPGEAAALAAFLVLAIYFAFAAVSGEHGLFARSAIEGDVARLQVERAGLDREVTGLRRRVDGLSDRSLDLELVDERIRDVLGYVRRDEIVLR